MRIYKCGEKYLRNCKMSTRLAWLNFVNRGADITHLTFVIKILFTFVPIFVSDFVK
jgi:hypothetical protein